MKYIKRILLSLAIMAGVSLTLAPVGVSALSTVYNACSGDASSTVCKGSADNTVQPLVATVVNTLLFIIGIVSVVMIIIGGITYATSAGESAQITKAKNTILYAIVGLVVAFLAYAIVNWVVLRLIGK